MTGSRTLTLLLASEAATRRAGAALAAALRPGDTVALSGPLGAGKSAFARAAVRTRLGDPEAEVPSPSYTLVNVYDAPGGEVWHADLYRLADVSEAAELGLEEAADHAVLLIEWPERMGEALPPRRLDIALGIAGPEARTALIAARGEGWEAALAALAALAQGED
jgi:tRNA threonylcarbamoyl adenosine modification protein YjeE